MKISAVIIAFNEEKKIAGAIRSVDWADEVIVVDSESTDRTREISESLGARVIIEKWRGFAAQKQFAVDQAAYDRILSIDADERVSDELRSDIIYVADTDDPADGYLISRLSTYMGREIRHSGWYPDRQLRFFDRRKAHWKDLAVHESVEMDPETVVSDLKGDLLHFSVDDFAQHSQIIQSRYAPLSAQSMFDRGIHTSRSKIMVLPLVTFLQIYLLKLGFVDGFAGMMIACFAAYNVFLKHLLLWERYNLLNTRDHK